ncbi:MAG: hypothetical protein KGS61_16980, partial [Verrucomicrobia bacterium]|nr:hypothetical protein [Verrucomicrobiota bacterium]
MSANPPKLTGIWHGYVSGTNRAPIIVRFQDGDGGVAAQAVVLDQQFGPSILYLAGKVEGQKAQFRLIRSIGSAPLMPLDGQITVTLNEQFTAADGIWATDLGTSGICKLLRSTEWDFRWRWRL